MIGYDNQKNIFMRWLAFGSIGNAVNNVDYHMRIVSLCLIQKTIV